jgi:hypothetical protein
MREQGPFVRVVIKDASGRVVNRVDGPTTPGFHRVNWDLRYPSKDVVELDEESSGGFFFNDGFLAMPGTYTATLTKVEAGTVTVLSDPTTFEVVPLREGVLEGPPHEQIAAFREEVEALQQALSTTSNRLQKQLDRVHAMQTALARAEQDAPQLVQQLHDARMELLQLNEEMNGSEAKEQIGERTPPTPRRRMFVGFRALTTTYGPTEMHRETVATGRNELAAIQDRLTTLVETTIPTLEEELRAAGAPPIEASY